MEKLFHDKKFFQPTRKILFFVVFLFLIFQTSGIAAESIEEAAKREGEVMFYSPLVTSDSQTLMSAFQKKYPFIKAGFYRGNDSTLLEKVLREKQMGHTFADVLNMVGIWINLYEKTGLLEKYASPEAKIFPQGFKDPEGYWTAYYTTYFLYIYNTRLVAKEELPKSYEDLLHPKWKGKIGQSVDDFEWFMGVLDLMGEEKGKQFMKRYADHDLRLRTGRTLIANLMVAGEFPLALGNVHRVIELQKLGAPVDMISFPTPTIAAMRCLGIHATAPHPNAAKLFVDFVLSREGQSIFTRISRHPVRPDVQVEPAIEAIRRNQFPVKPRDAELVQVYKKEYNKLFLKR